MSVLATKKLALWFTSTAHATPKTLKEIEVSQEC
jgi:hypothetical protein